MKSHLIAIVKTITAGCLLFMFSKTEAADYNIRDFGALPDGKTIATASIQKAINQCSREGGGRVMIPTGKFLTGMLALKDNVELHLERGAVLWGSASKDDYGTSKGEKALITAYEVINAALSGEGEIDGNGRAFLKGDNAPDRPVLISFKRSKKISITGITLKNSAFWGLHLLYDEDVVIDRIHIYSHANFNNDGIDIDSRNVTISNCVIDTDDDGICFKSDSPFICENVTVTNCVIASNCNFIKMGTASAGGFKNIAVSNCALRRASESNFRFWNKKNLGVIDSISGLAGIALEVVDGGAMDRISISNITMEGVQTPVFMRLGSRSHPTGSLRNIIISNIIARACSPIPSSITAVPGFYVDNVTLRDIFIEAPGMAGPHDAAPTIPENEKAYPENRMFGATLPAYGLFVRHVKNLTIDNLVLQLQHEDSRSALYFSDATQIKIDQLQAPALKNTSPVIMCDATKNLSISGYIAPGVIPLFLHLRDARTSRILLVNNDWNGVQKIYTRNAEVAPNAIMQK
ncbi:MAG: right-handed parallel beta-helix repeat-containing protein [Niabella sp.]|nr:right-handed parallel beta-helix repeat-containing protein [Niabella sp.]